MLQKYIVRWVAWIILLSSTGFGIIISQVEAFSIFKGPNPYVTEIAHSVIPAEAVLKKRLEYNQLISLSDSYRLLAIMQNSFIWNANSLKRTNDAIWAGEIILPFFPWVNLFTSYIRDDFLGFLRPELDDQAMGNPVLLNQKKQPLIIFANLNLIIGNLAKFPVYAQVGCIELPFGLHAQKVFAHQLSFIHQLFGFRLDAREIVGGAIGFYTPAISGMCLVGGDQDIALHNLDLLYGFIGEYRGHYKQLNFNLGSTFYFGKGQNKLLNASNGYLNIAQDSWEVFFEYGKHQNRHFNSNSILYLHHKINFEIDHYKSAFYSGWEKGSVPGVRDALPISQFFVAMQIEHNSFLKSLVGLKYDLKPAAPIGSLKLARFKLMLQVQSFF